MYIYILYIPLSYSETIIMIILFVFGAHTHTDIYIYIYSVFSVISDCRDISRQFIRRKNNVNIIYIYKSILYTYSFVFESAWNCFRKNKMAIVLWIRGTTIMSPK